MFHNSITGKVSDTTDTKLNKRLLLQWHPSKVGPLGKYKIKRIYLLEGEKV